MKKAQLYNDLKRKILTLELEPGSSLDETRLSEEYEISRTPLREVFRQLAGEGYLEIVNQRGTSVSSMNHNTLRNFFLTAPMLYAAIGQLAAENATAAQISDMKQAQAEFRQALEQQNTDGMVYWNDRFHILMGEMADNPYLQPSYKRLLIDHARISQTFYRPRDEAMAQDLNQAAVDHDEMIACIVAGDAEQMVQLIAAHWALSKAHMEIYIRPVPLNMQLADSETGVADEI